MYGCYSGVRENRNDADYIFIRDNALSTASIANQILHSDKDHQVAYVGGPNTPPNKSKVSDSRRL